MKTLGIKFEVAGVSEAQAGLNSLRSGLNSALTQNKKAIADYQREQSRSWREWKIENFGTLSQRQNLTIRQDKRELRERSTYKDLSVNNRALVLEFRLAYKDFFGQLETLLEELKPEKTGFTDMLGSLITTPLKFAFDALLFPFQSMVSGAFERLGEVQVQDFAEGFNKNLQRALGLSFEETGGDVGNVIGKSLYKVYQKSIDSVDQYVKGTLQFNLADTLIDAFKHTVKTLAKELPALALRTHRRIQINKSAIPEARRAAGRRIIDNDLPETTRKDIEQNKSITLVYGGANTDPSDIGKDYMARVMKPYLKGSAVIPVARQWTNSAVDSEFQGDMKNLIKLIISNPVTAQTFKSFVSENGLKNLGAVEQKELVDSLDLGGAIDLSSLDRLAEIIQSLLGNKDFALGKALQATFNGYNPDDVLGAAEAIALMEQFPDKDLQIGGFSHGGYNALGTVDLLNRMGYDKVKGFSIGTPITGANATVNPDNFRSFMGDEDYYYKALTGLAGDEIDFPEFFEVGKKEGAMHSLQGYVRGDDLKGGLQAFLGDRVSLPSKDKYGKHDSSYGYAVGELGAETALIRTLLTYLGESQLGTVKAKEGFVFSAEETLPGYTGNIKKLGQNLKDEDTKKFHVEYIDFLETLQQELEIAEQLAAIGKKYKPIKSLQKAAKIFPTMEGLAAKHTTVGMSDAELEAATSEAQSKEKYVFFQRKVKQQKDNIERTFQAMLGRQFSAKDEAKGIYSFYNSEQYDERAGNFEGMVNWLENDILGGASDGEKEQAQPTLELLKKITQSIRETGSTGQFDLSTARSAEKLLGIDLKEFNLLFKEFESNDRQKIDVNRYQDELTTARRNRDQILNEKKTPVEVAKSLSEARKKITAVDATPAVELNTQQLQSAFSDYLAEIIRKGTEYGTQFLRDNANQIKPENFNEAEVTSSFNELNTQFKSATKEYRKAVSDGNMAIATQLAEDLLFQSGSLKRIYGELVRTRGVGSPDTRELSVGQIQNEDTAKSIRGFSGYLTSVQTEVIGGQPNLKGRADRGLPDLIPDNPAFESQVRQINFAPDIRAGVEKIINRETGEEIGYQFVLGINQGGQQAADINSPSRVWQWIGQMIKAGFEGGVNGIGDFLGQSMQEVAEATQSTVQGVAESVSNLAGELDQSQGLLDPLLQTEGADEAVNDFFGNLITKASETFDSLTQQFPVLGRISDFLMSIGGEILQTLGLFTFGEALIGFADTAVATAMEMESLEQSIIAVSNSAADGADNISFVRKEAQRLSIDVKTATEAYKRLLGATRNTPLEGFQTEKLFSTLSTTARNRGLTPDATNRLFLGFEQVIAKGEYKSEEVRGQLTEVLGDIQPLLARSVGVPINQLGELMESGSLKMAEVTPKLMALLDAQNALGDTANTAQAAQTRFNNSILNFQNAVGRKMLPARNLGLDSLASVLQVLQNHANTLIKLVTGLVTTVLVDLTLKLLATKLAVNGVVVGLGRLIGLLTSAPFLSFAAKFTLITIALEVWGNVIDRVKNSHLVLSDDIKVSTQRLEALRKAFGDAGDAASDFDKKQPKQLQLNEGAEVGNWTPGNGKILKAIAGGDRWNLDNFVNNRVQRFYDWQFNAAESFYKAIGLEQQTQGLKGLAARNRPQTYAQQKQDDFIVETSTLISNIDSTLGYSNQVKSFLDDLATLDTKARDLQSQTRNVGSGDSEGLKKALQAENAVLKERDELLKKPAQYQEAIQGSIADAQARLSRLDELDKTGGDSDEIAQRKSLRKSLEDRIEALESEKKAIDEINGRIPKFLSQVNRLLRNSGERVKGFIGSQEDNAVVNRNQIIEQALANGLSDAQLEVKLDNLSTTDLKDRISFVNQEIKSLEDKLSNAYLKEGVAGLERAAKLEAEQDGKSYLGLTSDVLTRMAGEGRSSAETEAANILLALDEYQGILGESQSGLLDSIKTSQDKLKDFNKTIADYFYRLTQQIKEATLETQRLISDIFYTDVKNKLLGALAPGSNTFVNGIIDNVQSIIDQAGQVAQKIFGDSAAELGFESETRTLATEMQDFLKEVKGASEALDEFANKLKGTGTSSSSNFSSATTDNLTALRRAIIGKESGTNFKAVNPDSGALGYGQVMPANVASWTKQALGKTLTPEQFLNDSLAQVEVINFKLSEYLQKELKQGYDLDTAVRRVASTWYSGKPGNYNKTKARFYNGKEYPSDDSYTKDILSRFKAQGGGTTNANSSITLGAKSQVSDWKPAQQNTQTKKIVFAPGHFSDYNTGTSGASGRGVNTDGKHVSLESFATNRATEIFAQVGKENGFDTEVFRGSRGANISSGHASLASKENQGAYSIELHFDAPGGKSGVIPGNKYSNDGRFLHDYDEKLAADFGSFSWNHRKNEGGLSAPRNGISILELAPMQGDLEKSIRKASSSGDYTEFDRYLTDYANRFFNSLNPDISLASGNVEAKTLKVNQELVAAKAKNLELTKEQTQQLRESLETEVKNKIELNRRQGKQGRQESNAAVLGVEDKIFSFKNQYGYQSATAELTNNLRSLKQQFLDADLDIASQITNTEDAILSITNSIPVFTEQIAKFKAIGTPETLAAASIQQSALDELNKTLPTMQANLLKLQSLSAKMPGLQQQSEYFLRDQGIFKTEQEQLTKANSILSQKATLTEARGTLEEKRQVRLEQEDLRLELEIKDIQLNTPEGIERNTKILNAQRQSKVNKENIDYDAQLEELDIERKLLDYQSGIGDKKAGFMSRFGALFGAEKLKKENAIAQEKLRFERELIELEKQYKGEPEKLNRLTQAARELNSVNLLSIEREFKSLGNTVEDYFGSAAQGFFTQFTTNFFDGKASSDRALLEERLRYAEEVVGLENSNRDTEGKLAHLKNRARELNEEKLDKIRGEFNLFSRTIDLAKGALLEFVKQLAQLAAQQAASKFISSILGSILGGVGGKAAKVGNDYGSGAGTFTASEGITVGEIENYRTGGEIKKRKVSDRYTDLLKQNIPGVKSAWSSEGSDAQLGVFHTGEELLSRKTGEAGRYQALKYKLGINPLAKIANYESGGTIPEVGSSILSGIASSRPRIDYSFLSSGVGAPVAAASKTINIKTTVVTPNADSFKLNQDQMNQDLIERLRRGI